MSPQQTVDASQNVEKRENNKNAGDVIDRVKNFLSRLLRPVFWALRLQSHARTSDAVGDLVLVHHLRLPSWPRNCLQDPYCGPHRIIRMDGSRIHVRCSPHLGGELLCAPKQLRYYHSPHDLSWDEWRLSDSEVKHST